MENAFEQYARLYVIGDIHGRLDLLDQLIDAIRRDADQFSGNSLTVTLGDYIDRGPNSRGVIERLMTNPFPCDYVPLKGNHDAMLNMFLDDPSIGPMWRKLGGLETLRSFGISLARFTFGRKYKRAAEQLRTVISSEHLNFLAFLKTSLTIGRYFFCHAGVRPGVALERQSEEDLLWIREEFTKSKTNFGKIVVHGHTPVAKPEVLPNRINIDTGAFASGRLTCLILEAASHRIIST